MNETNMTRIWNKFTPLEKKLSNGAGKQTNTPLKRKVFVAMSGGVDSSVAAALLKKQGYDVVGVHMRCFNVDGCAERDAEDARRVAGVLKIPFYVWDFEKEYKERVVQYMIQGYKAGITPNPDVMCNREIKFGFFLDRALEMGAEYVATGHYVRLRNTKKYEYTKTVAKKLSYIRKPFVFRSLFVAKDTNKDQSYFLWTLTQDQLKHCLFPIGDYLKSEVRKMAQKFGLPTAEKKDSQGICFLGQVTLADFLKEYIPARPGLVLNANGQKLGEHKGASLYTIGQRHGFTVRTRNEELGTRNLPHYVVSKNVKANTLTVAEGDEDSLFRKEVQLTDVNFIVPASSLKFPVSVLSRVRYRQTLVKARLAIGKWKLVNGGSKNETELPITNYNLQFTKPIKFIAPGQSAVFYRKAPLRHSSGSKSADFEMLGGGIIVQRS